MKNEYKAKAALGAVYAVACSGNGKRILKTTPDVAGLRNRFAFSQSMRGCPDPALQDEWLAYGAASFSLEVLEELRQKDDQTVPAFREELALLRELWLEKLGEENK